VRDYGGNIVFCGDNPIDRYIASFHHKDMHKNIMRKNRNDVSADGMICREKMADELSHRDSLTLIPSYNHPHIMAGE
jgi:hypothetical protein